MIQRFISLLSLQNLTRLASAGLLSLGMAGAPALAQEKVDVNASPNDFVQTVGLNALNAVKQSTGAKQGDIAHINQIVDTYVLPYVNLEKTTRLAAGRHWRQATPQQQKALVEAFKGTLIRTYSGAFTKVDSRSNMTVQPFRGDASADDVVVRTLVMPGNGPSVGVDYRLEKSPQGWKIYDLNVEGIWLIQNYRNQFAQQITQNGMDGLISALNRQGS
jgi:phospholipid transport system substrate-binding protein